MTKKFQQNTLPKHIQPRQNIKKEDDVKNKGYIPIAVVTDTEYIGDIATREDKQTKPNSGFLFIKNNICI